MEPLSQSQGADTDLSVQGVLPFSPVPSVLVVYCGVTNHQTQHTSSALLCYFYYLGILEGKLIQGRLRLIVRHLECDLMLNKLDFVL